MEVGVVQYEARLQRLLHRFLDPSFEVRTDSYLNILLSHLSGNDGKDLNNSLLKLPLFSEWIFQSVSHWELTNTGPSASCAVFTLHLTSLLSKCELRFVKFNAQNVYLRLCNIIQVRKQNSTPSIKLAYIKLLSSFLEHEAGIQWLIATDNWQDALSYCLANQTVYIIREGHTFIHQLLVKAVPYNEIFCSIIVERIVSTLRDVHYQNGTQILEVNGEQLQTKVLPTLQLVTYILESELKSPSYSKRDYQVPALFLNGSHLEQATWNIILVCQHQELLFVLHKLMFLNYFFSLSINSKDEIFRCPDLHNTISNICKLLKMNFDKCYIINTLKLCHYAYYYWSLMQSRIPTPKVERPIIFENQLIVIQASPLYVIAYKYCEIHQGEIEEEFFRENFVYRVLRVLCEQTIRMLYNWRAVLVAEKEKNLFDIAQKSIIYIMMTRKYYNRDRAVTVFTLVLYTLKDIVNIIKAKPFKAEIFNKQVGFMTSMIDGLATFISDFDISWRESVESICVLQVSLDFIGLSCWPSKLVVQALKLVNLAIARFMSPNLALLVDRTNDSSMSLLVPMLTAKLHDMDWDVRDSALEILHTISSIAHSKFPSFQTMLLDSGLLPVIVSMGTSDSESFVRASAIKCLTQMIKVPAFWSHVLELEQIPQKMIDIIHNETEAIVRSEAASLMCRIYEHQSFGQDIMDDVYRAMMQATVTDLHWEVKVKALCFWDKSICNRLQDQGMIDGSFPSVTFSKENRKIVTLTENEIKNRLNKVLTDLSKCGCLAALVYAMEDDSDIKVSEKAVRITTKLKELLLRHNLAPKSTVNFVLPQPAMNNSNPVDIDMPTADSDDVIEEIVGFKDASLLVNVCNPSDDPVKANGVSSHVKVVTPEEFLGFIRKDLDAMVKGRRKWLDGIDDLGSLLDDMLRSYDSDDVNAMDCY